MLYIIDPGSDFSELENNGHLKYYTDDSLLNVTQDVFYINVMYFSDYWITMPGHEQDFPNKKNIIDLINLFCDEDFIDQNIVLYLNAKNPGGGGDLFSIIFSEENAKYLSIVTDLAFWTSLISLKITPKIFKVFSDKRCLKKPLKLIHDDGVHKITFIFPKNITKENFDEACLKTELIVKSNIIDADYLYSIDSKEWLMIYSK